MISNNWKNSIKIWPSIRIMTILTTQKESITTTINIIIIKDTFKERRNRCKNKGVGVEVGGGDIITTIVIENLTKIPSDNSSIERPRLLKKVAMSIWKSQIVFQRISKANGEIRREGTKGIKGFLDKNGKNSVDSSKIITRKSLEGKSGKVKGNRSQDRVNKIEKNEIFEKANGKKETTIK